VITVNEDTRAPLSVINVNMEQVSFVSSLYGVANGTATFLETTSTKKNKESIQNVECKVEVAEAYQENINEMKATGRHGVSKGYLITLICQTKKRKRPSQ
jgi:hypothetical protein